MRQFDTTSGAIAGTFADQAMAGRALGALREAGFSTAHLGLDASSPVEVAGAHRRRWRPSPILGAAVGGAGAVLAEATILAVPPTVPTILDGSLIAATLGGALGMAVAGVAAVAERSEPDLLTELRRGSSVITVTVRGRVRRERARGMLRQHGASRTVDLDAEEEEVRFARPFSEAVPRLRLHCDERFGPGRWDEYMPAYLFGWDRAGRPDLDESDWNDVQPELQREWTRRHPDRRWGEVQDAVIAGWEKAQASGDH